ncbi:MAG: Protein of unknown function (DUF1703)/Predicted AAA-ATPase [Gammaproteobacteria bacterium]|nr:Protein of unknown function (DUF1703)/Predicted AAA-ATPase [Gammaproteobacteria bacterium]
MIQLPIGYDNFRKIVENKLDFVDKSLFIKEIIDNKATEVTVITRPRRFGKTLNLSMLHHYLAKETYGESTEGLFDGLKIMRTGEQYLQHYRKYPVIFITFKDVKDHDYETTYAALGKLMSHVYSQHHYLLSSEKLMPYQKENFESILREKVTKASIQSSLFDLTNLLYLHHGVKPWLLIDEYDSPIQSSYVHGYYEQMISLMRNLFGSALKTNPYLYKAVITGILRVAKESLFSGLNNLEVYSLLRSEYSQYFGFTEEEMDALLVKSELNKQSVEIKSWYNGYQIGDSVVYNPWSVANCIKRKGELIPYWVNTSDNQLVRNLIVRSSMVFKDQFELLLKDKSVECPIDENTVFGDLEKNESAVWSLLLMAGYLKVTSQYRTEQGLQCTLAIPNQEVRSLYRQIVEQWLSSGHGIDWYNRFLDHLLTGNLERFEYAMKEIMEQTVSSHDVAHQPEAFYHGLMLGLTASLHTNPNYEIKSNRESGYGRYDYMIFSHDPNKPTILLEFKRADAIQDPQALEINLIKTAKEAIEQINQLGYVAEAKQRGCTNILKIGLAFCGKRFKIEHEYL